MRRLRIAVARLLGNKFQMKEKKPDDFLNASVFEWFGTKHIFCCSRSTSRQFNRKCPIFCHADKKRFCFICVIAISFGCRSVWHFLTEETQLFAQCNLIKLNVLFNTIKSKCDKRIKQAETLFGCIFVLFSLPLTHSQHYLHNSFLNWFLMSHYILISCEFWIYFFILSTFVYLRCCCFDLIFLNKYVDTLQLRSL